MCSWLQQVATYTGVETMDYGLTYQELMYFNLPLPWKKGRFSRMMASGEVPTGDGYFFNQMRKLSEHLEQPAVEDKKEEAKK